MRCEVCGNEHFTENKVLWDDLVNQWQISEFERDYIDRQQGMVCSVCGCNIRSQALAKSILQHWQHGGTFSDFVKTKHDLKVLEMNGAAQLTHFLSEMPNRVLAEYPEIDMCALPYEDCSFDLVLHSDTLEHVPSPVTALKECRRVLKEGGLLAYTVPVIVDRMTRTRDGLPPSYHGLPGDNADDYIVVSEYGADAWKQMIEAGFEHVKITTFDYPAGIAINASVGKPRMIQQEIKTQKTFLQRVFGTSS